MTDDGPISRDQYDRLAPQYGAITGAATREDYEWPAVASLLPPLDGQRVLDAACGTGFYTERLVERGASAVGVDASPEMVDRARERFADDDRVRIERADLTDGLAAFDDEAFDLVLCQLALEHIADWGSAFAGFERVLRPGGRAVVSTSNPVRDYVDAEFGVREQVRADGATYEDVERVDRDWGDVADDLVLPFHRRSLEAVFQPATDAGLLVERVVEPDVTEAFRDARPELADQFGEGPPLFLCLRFLKPAAGGDGGGPEPSRE